MIGKDQQFAVEEQWITFIAVIAKATPGIFCCGLHLGQFDHIFDLARVGVAAVAAARTFLATEGVVRGLTGKRASRAEPPLLGLVERWIHLIHPHAAALGIELAIRHQFADGHVGRPFIAQRW